METQYMEKISKVTWDIEAWNDYCELIEKNEKRQVVKIIKLIKDIQRNGFDKGIGKPEPLKYDLSGMWSREITGADRLVYYVRGDELKIAQCRTHYTEVKK